MPCRGSRPRRTIPARFRLRRASRLAADPTESGSHPERRSLFGLCLHALGVLLALLVDLELFFEELAAVHLRVQAAVLEKLAMRSALDDAPVVEHEDLDGVLDRGDAVRDDDARSLAHHAAEAAKYLSLGVGIY